MTTTCLGPDKRPRQARTRRFHRLLSWRGTIHGARLLLRSVNVARAAPRSAALARPALLLLRQFLVEI